MRKTYLPKVSWAQKRNSGVSKSFSKKSILAKKLINFSTQKNSGFSKPFLAKIHTLWWGWLTLPKNLACFVITACFVCKFRKWPTRNSYPLVSESFGSWDLRFWFLRINSKRGLKIPTATCVKFFWDLGLGI